MAVDCVVHLCILVDVVEEFSKGSTIVCVKALLQFNHMVLVDRLDGYPLQEFLCCFGNFDSSLLFDEFGSVFF